MSPVRPSDEEDKYFASRELAERQEVRRKAEQAAAELHHREEIARAVGGDIGLAERVRSLGFDGENAKVLRVLPLVAVAWADGSVSKRERAAVLDAAEKLGIAPGGSAWVRVAAWLEEYPSETLREQIMEILRLAVAQDPSRATNIVEMMYAVAESAGGFLGFGDKVSDSERAMIEAIAAQFSLAARKSVTGA
jgi:tellurite resistance protein